MLDVRSGLLMWAMESTNNDRHYKLLASLKTTVEGLLATHSSNVWNTYGGLERLCSKVEAILQHHLKIVQNPRGGGSVHDYWMFLQGLRWLQPLGPTSRSSGAHHLDQVLVSSPALATRDNEPSTHAHGHSGSFSSDADLAFSYSSSSCGYSWLKNSLLNHSLSAHLRVLLDNKPHVQQFYHEDAFLRQDCYVEALLICLQAVEQNKPEVLSDLDYALLVESTKPQKQIRNSTSTDLKISQSQNTWEASASLCHEANVSDSQCMPKQSTDPPVDSVSNDSNTRTLQCDGADCYAVDASVIEESSQHNSLQSYSPTATSEGAVIQAAVTSLQTSRTEPLKYMDSTTTLQTLTVDVQDPTAKQAVHLSTDDRNNSLTHCTVNNVQTSMLFVDQRDTTCDNVAPVCNDNIPVLSYGGRTSPTFNEKCAECASSNNGACMIAHSSSISTSPCKYEHMHHMARTLSTQQVEANVLEHAESKSTMSELIDEATCVPNQSTLCESDSTIHASDQTMAASDSQDDSGSRNVMKDISSTLAIDKADSQSEHALPSSKQQSGESDKHRKTKHVRSVSDYGLADMQKEKLDQRLRYAASCSPANRYCDSTEGNIRRSTSVCLHGLDHSAPKSTLMPLPKERESLIGYLQSQDFNTAADLDKENAHFSISEALISIIEQIKWDQWVTHRDAHAKQTDHRRSSVGWEEEDEGEESDEEIQHLKQKIRIRRREKRKKKSVAGQEAQTLSGQADAIHNESLLFAAPSLSHDVSPASSRFTSRTSSCSSDSMLQYSQGESSDTDEILDIQLSDEENHDHAEDKKSNLVSMKQSGLSLSLASMYSDVELLKQNNELSKQSSMDNVSAALSKSSASLSFSAEYVAISLLQKFPESQIPKADELRWLVSEKDAPQALLPMPSSLPMGSPESAHATRIRGNMEWAPPRIQIIFNIHPPPKRKELLMKQNNLCAGCGARVERGYTKRYLYCDYLGKYFCPRCHSNQMAYIPARIIRRWDFAKKPVSNFAYDLLNKIHNDPLFDVYTINPGLRRKVKDLDSVRQYKEQVKHLSLFLHTCKMATRLYEKVKSLPEHWTTDLNLFTIKELIQLREKELLPVLKNLVSAAIEHVESCQLCCAKGFICELCTNNEIIYPYQLLTVTQCNECRTCFHKDCFLPEKCPKCARIEARKLLLSHSANRQPFSDESSEEDEPT